MSSLYSARNREWRATPFPGIEICPMGGGDAVNSAAYRVAAGVVLPPHQHPVWELVTVLSGSIRLGDAVMKPGDVLHTGPGETHDIEAHEESVFIVTVGQDRQLG
ncbi:cupin domain-containing protein [Iodidimonas sp. SYSU 1G8]|uniref:cupin domain-containing protein n=1 Tax=Iodidimonas sp. SYSU 1G8 TaxID=3133967 RepID=UPI0031FED8EE